MASRSVETESRFQPRVPVGAAASWDMIGKTVLEVRNRPCAGKKLDDDTNSALVAGARDHRNSMDGPTLARITTAPLSTSPQMRLHTLV